MLNTDIIKLIDAGLTAEQLKVVLSGDAPSPVAADPKPAMPDDAAAATQTPVTQPTPDYIQRIDALSASVQSLVEQMQISNRRSANAVVQPPSVDDVVARMFDEGGPQK